MDVTYTSAVCFNYLLKTDKLRKVNTQLLNI